MKTKVRCMICPKGCELAPGETGDCRVRKNIGGEVVCTTYALPCSINVDPIEKKPLYHFLPGTPILSIATAGCNLHCRQCQNWQISQAENVVASPSEIFPADIAQMAKTRNCPAIAYTYTEPLVSYEYTYDCCVAAAEAGIKNVLVTAAYINPEPLREICQHVFAANVDLKSFSDDFYRNVCDARLKPVLNALVTMKECGVMLEITNLLIPTLNDSENETKQLCGWIAENLGVETPLHFSRFFPQNKLQHLPPTPTETLLRAREIARETGLKYVYVGNMQDSEGESTTCPGCGELLIERRGYTVRQNHILGGACPACQAPIPGIWE
ncbi:MAG: AmmeMemoRadiSam system radical SAM enzyme [Kiritimatiellales bacterium]|nr:AmmeMemoRadiSam system radical SAM enzyme [Kiritimatiellales bacterium]MCF7864012.1 AmmeMemoRadiSam system radical SAM enzyme [Kiritimatiellales bacterium]